MTLQVILIGTGGVGEHALRGLIRNPLCELTGVWVSSDAKAGRDAGELVGPDVSAGVLATTDRIEITGEPSYSMDFNLSSRNGDHAYAGMVATASRVVNNIAAVVGAPPGVVTTLDLPLSSGKGLYGIP